MDISDMAPIGGGDLRGPAAPSISKLAGSFTPTASPQPDDIWNPRGREVGVDDRRADPYGLPGAGSERPVQRDYTGMDGALSFADVAGNVRAAVRP